MRARGVPPRRGPCTRRARRRPDDRSPRTPRGTTRASARGRTRRGPRARSRRRGGSSAEGALQLVEEPLVRTVRLVARQALEFLEQTELLHAELARGEDVDQHSLVAAPESLENR